MNKKFLSLFLLGVLLTLPLMSLVLAADGDANVDGAAKANVKIDSDVGIWKIVFPTPLAQIGRYVFGPVPTGVVNSHLSAIIIVIAVWLLIMVTFGDIISSFSTFSKPVSWISAFLIGVVTANLGFGARVIAYGTMWFAFAGGAAVFLGLSAALVAFVIVNLGVTKLGPWIMGRKAMMEAQKRSIDTAAAATDVGAAIKGMKQIGEDLRR